MFAKAVCWMFGHEWEAYVTYLLSVESGQKVTDKKKCECPRCGKDLRGK
jgi:hypothetical protein